MGIYRLSMKSIQEESVQIVPVLRAIINPNLLPPKKEALTKMIKEEEIKKVLMPQQQEGYIKAKKHDCL